MINARDYCPAGLTACMVQGADGYEVSLTERIADIKLICSVLGCLH